MGMSREMIYQAKTGPWKGWWFVVDEYRDGWIWQSQAYSRRVYAQAVLNHRLRHRDECAAELWRLASMLSPSPF
jgi:hypothetical protein